MNALSEFFGVYAFDAIWLTLKLALITSGLLLLVTLPLAWFLANWHSKAKPFVMSVLALPLVLPPTVLGFYLLIAFSPQSALGQGWHTLTGSNLAFSFEGLVLGSVLYSLPFALQPLYGGFSQLDARYLDVAKTLGFSATEAFVRIVLPLSKAPIIVALGLSFAHTIGEFGVVLMIGGNIPGETQVLSIALYEQVEALEYEKAHNLAIALLVFSFVLLAALYRFNGIASHFGSRSQISGSAPSKGEG
ncbi:MAG: molybdate ABC transporter permease subunit [Gammaproteobacteria bacterium]|nr:molybdate ABC transporter permease subunit [Gammaproteobacteria bacterium]